MVEFIHTQTTWRESPAFRLRTAEKQAKDTMEDFTFYALSCVFRKNGSELSYHNRATINNLKTIAKNNTRSKDKWKENNLATSPLLSKIIELAEKCGDDDIKENYSQWIALLGEGIKTNIVVATDLFSRTNKPSAYIKVKDSDEKIKVLFAYQESRPCLDGVSASKKYNIYQAFKAFQTDDIDRLIEYFKIKSAEDSNPIKFSKSVLIDEKAKKNNTLVSGY